MIRRRVMTTAAVAVLGTAGLFTAASTAYAADNVVKTQAPIHNGENTGYMKYKYSTNHGWVCDTNPDGYQVYAVWYFHGGAFGTAYRRNAPSRSCKGDFFDKRPYNSKVCLNLPNAVDPCTWRQL
ncbi:hypothetical protein E1293_40795 [Actinomadura darangshiensis]|uniref:Secreted protein n=1 Tax=Actinomadura darangshiensis TaxID=705336 RepID=A0A4V2YR97_9ACTN|nr:hypothetical protein [Actinomadura darangshiensis]TDD65027.1 hypothetical protein E1293_40795 [Actinomadura darangshiensis]